MLAVEVKLVLKGTYMLSTKDRIPRCVRTYLFQVGGVTALLVV